MDLLRTLGGQIKEFRKASILTPLCMIFEVIFEMIIPLLMGRIVDEGINGGDLHQVYVLGGYMILCAIGGLVCGFLGGMFGAQASAGFARNLRQAMFENIQNFSFSNIDKFSTAGLVTRLTTDVTNIQNAYQMILRMCFRSPLSLIVAMALSFMISPKLASIYLIAVLILGSILMFMVTRAMKYFDELFVKYDGLNASVQENVSSIRVVKAFVREQFELTRFEKASLQLYMYSIRAEQIVVSNAPMMQLTVYTCIILISWFGAHEIVGGSIDTGNLATLLAYCMNILMSLMMLSFVFVMISMSGASAKRICEVLREQPDITNPEKPVFEVQDGSIRFDHVNFAYRKGSGNDVLSDINLEIRSGETIGIIGGTGSAKTSLVNLISRLYDVTEGSVSVGGRDVREYDLEVLRKQVSVVLQKNVLFSGTILENLRWGDKEATDEECIEACRMACADEFIEQFPDKYQTHIEQGGTNVSGGQKQRLCIARALLKKPKVLILDDSTSAVDTATDAKIRKAFREAIPGTTKIIISQRVSSVQDADRILVMEDGRVDGFASHEELLRTNEIYRDVYESQTNGTGDFDEGGDN